MLRSTAGGAANIIHPADAKSPLLRVCQALPDGKTVIAQDNQWWNQIIWVLGAYDHAMWSGDRQFLRQVLEIGSSTSLPNTGGTARGQNHHVGGSPERHGVRGRR